MAQNELYRKKRPGITKTNSNEKWLLLQRDPSTFGPRLYLRSGVSLIQHVGAEAERLLLKCQQDSYQIIEVPASWRLLPCGFDLQTHLRLPGQSTKETLYGGLASAIAGGYDGLVSMPNTRPVIDNPRTLENTLRLAQSATRRSFAGFSVYFTGAGTRDLRGQYVSPIAALKEAGAVAITDDGHGIQNTEVMRQVFGLCERSGLPFFQHCEIEGHGGVASESQFQSRSGLRIYPQTAESEMLKRDLSLLRDFPELRYHALHLSTKESVDLIKKAKDRGLRVTSEVSPHHLFFCNEDIPEIETKYSTSFKMNPPLFSKNDRQVLREAFRSGDIDCLSTDHAPHESKLKARGWAEAPFGTRGLETAFSVLHSLKNEIDLSESRIVDSFAHKPREILFGAKAPKTENFFFFDASESWRVDESDLPGISENSCFLQSRLEGRVKLAILGDSLYKPCFSVECR